MYAAASGKGETGIPKKVAQEMIEATPKKAYRSLPEKKIPVLKRKGGK